MTRLDEVIRQTLPAEDAELLARFEAEPGAIVEVSALFEGARAPFNRLLLAAAFAIAGCAIYTAVRFAAADDLHGLAYWGALTGAGLAVVLAMRLWFAMELQANRVLRELKRLELQVARLAARSAG